jgi:hypothetical protein
MVEHLPSNCEVLQTPILPKKRAPGKTSHSTADQTENYSTLFTYIHLPHTPFKMDSLTAYQDSYFHPYQCLLIWTVQTSVELGLSSAQTVSEKDNREMESLEKDRVTNKNLVVF